MKQRECVNPLSDNRFQAVDFYRGLAFISMFIYHFCFFFNYYHFTKFHFFSKFGWIFQISIAGSFFILVGISLYLAHSKGIRYKKFFFRLSKIIFCACIITIVSFFINPGFLVTFGILHSITVCTILGLVFLRPGNINLLFGICFILLGKWFKHDFFNSDYLQWIGFFTFKKATFDIQPLFPWIGVVVIGIWSAPFLIKSRLTQWQASNPTSRFVTLIGRHTLLLYMAHVPFIFCILEILRLLSRK